MSLSADYSDTINLYCNEAVGELFSSDIDLGIVESPSSSFTIQDESSSDGVFDSEIDQMLEPELVLRLLELSDLVHARQNAVNWILKVHSYYQFSPETAYLSVNYLDRFLSFHSFPDLMEKGKGWPMQLLAVACLSVAAKLEEANPPLLMDLQILEPRFLFKPITVQRMELLVMAKLKWRLHIITPFYFLHSFIENSSCLGPADCHNVSSVFSRSSELVIGICKDINFLDYTPSAIAAAAVIWVTNQRIDDPKLECFHYRTNKDMVRRCYNLIKMNMAKLPWNRVINGTIHERCHASKFCSKEMKTTHNSSTHF